jgi:hypothetical protein
MQQPNEFNASTSAAHPWPPPDGAGSLTYGVAPNYPCCAVNHAQGLPAFIAGMLLASNGGLVVAALGPFTAVVNVSAPRASPRYASLGYAPGAGLVLVNVSTAYPFGDTVLISVTGAPAGMPLRVRVPSWASAATLAVDGGAPVPVANGSLALVALAGGAETVLTLELRPEVRTVLRGGGALSVHRGALAYALPLQEVWVPVKTWGYGSAVDYHVLNSGATPWNAALVISGPGDGGAFAFVGGGEPPSIPWASNATNVLRVRIRAVTAWAPANGSAGPPPASPVGCGAMGACGAEFEAVLHPFGSTRLRMGVLPWTPPV